jgi:hypothetical protein
VRLNYTVMLNYFVRFLSTKRCKMIRDELLFLNKFDQMGCTVEALFRGGGEGSGAGWWLSQESGDVLAQVGNGLALLRGCVGSVRVPDAQSRDVLP